MDLFVRIYYGFAFWLEPISNCELGFGSNGYLLENSICSRFFYLPDLFIKFAFDERIKTNHGCCFYLFTTAFRNYFCDKLGQRRIEFGENWFGSFDICRRLFGDTEEECSVIN